ncbi:MAG: MAPEG family protein [Gammaproteobacteria bacterium]|nr:MAPEG family protein [Gammaproteobacteria bacterium]MDP2140300.1 MAPEG family protein [Gammaproteobacteria bacterium]MDP2346182.1 MAPEG family protein [Gammaproteobacteria bacterium]
MTLQITSILTGLFSLMMVALSLQVSLRRRQLNVSAGDANDIVLRRRIRAHGNFIEYAPLMVLAVAIIEYNAGPRWLLAGLALAFLLSRVLHAIGMLTMEKPTLRAMGIVLQHAAFVVAGMWLLLSVL